MNISIYSSTSTSFTKSHFLRHFMSSMPFFHMILTISSINSMHSFVTLLMMVSMSMVSSFFMMSHLFTHRNTTILRYSMMVSSFFMMSHLIYGCLISISSIHLMFMVMMSMSSI